MRETRIHTATVAIRGKEEKNRSSRLHFDMYVMQKPSRALNEAKEGREFFFLSFFFLFFFFLQRNKKNIRTSSFQTLALAFKCKLQSRLYTYTYVYTIYFVPF